jgi:hypothetical protein
MSGTKNLEDVASNLPLEVKTGKLFGAWYYISDHKVPTNPHTGCNAKTNVADDWGTFDQAAEYLRCNQNTKDGEPAARSWSTA